MRSTKIICTIGPATSSPEGLSALIDSGMNIARLNRSHGTQEKCKEVINFIRNYSEKHRLPIGIMVDTKGGEIRTGAVIHPIEIKKGQEVIFSPVPIPEEERTVIEVSYNNFYKDVPETDTIILDGGDILFDIVSTSKNKTVIGRARGDGSIGSRRHINLPGADIDLPSITDKDWEDIEFAIKEGADFLALSFIRNADEVRLVRKFLQDKKSNIRIITKVETHQAVEHISEIIEVSDAIMVARGDLGTNLPFEEIPTIQDKIVTLCRDKGIPVIVATDMLESMTEHPMPTRAEVTDVAHAAMTGADATMLSGETAVGQFPFKAIEAMSKVLIATEKHKSRFPSLRMPVHNDREARAEAASTLSDSANADAILVFTRTGRTAQEVCSFRPMVPIIAATENLETKRKLTLCYGVHPIKIEFGSTPEDTIIEGIRAAKELELIKEGQSVVLLSDTEAKDAAVQSVQVRTV
ncbi:MAG: pyruvate kinase [Candidatus Peribacteraceae bacterium]|jgi:pyruvate kinase|nr:pyruvate kinase [Candidatus Peribacteraceae bacterium]MDP7645873.1 pyruvate kinase [Candidatus Peribacteraceae bacterium]